MFRIIFLDVCSHCVIFRNVLYRPYVMICNAKCVIVYVMYVLSSPIY